MTITNNVASKLAVAFVATAMLFTLAFAPVAKALKENEVRIIEELLAGKKPQYRGYSVCLECKLANNPCRISVLNKPCLGPIGQGGCGAICISGGSPCYACFGFREGAEIENLVKVLKNLTTKEEIEQYFTMFYKHMPELQEKVKELLK